MDEGRIKRYKEKLNLIGRRISQITEWTNNLTGEDFKKDELIKLATYKAFQEIVDGSMDIIAMLCKDLGITPKDDYTNIDALLDKGVLDDTLSEVMIMANGLRDRIMHEYNTLSDERAFVEIRESLSEFEKFIEVIENWIKRH